MDGNDRGFSLIELLIAMAVGLIVLAAVSALFSIQSKHLADSEIIAELHQNTRIAIEMMVREINMAGYNQRRDNPTATKIPRCTNAIVTAGTPPCVGITNAGASAISFSTDIDGDGDITADSTNPNENIVYDLYTTDGVQTLGRTSNGVKNPVVNDVESLSFLYYDESGNITAEKGDVRKVKIIIRVRSSRQDPNYTDATYGDHYRHYTLSSFAFLRNLALE